MSILISGLINFEITLQVESFPVTYSPVRYPFFGVNSSVSGVGFNLAKALTALGNEVSFLSLIGQDPARTLVKAALQSAHIPGAFVLDRLEQTPHSVILYDTTGQRAIHVDLKDIQEQTYPPERFEAALEACSLACLCNINFSRPFLVQAKHAGKRIASDVHTISDLDDAYNRDFMAQADLLFMSDERLLCSPEEWAARVQNRYGNEIIVVGLGAEGALLAVKSDHFMERTPAIFLRKIANTIGAGDALFSAFVHVYNQTRDPYEAIKKAVIFAGYKIGDKGAADGFLDEARLNTYYAAIFKG